MGNIIMCTSRVNIQRFWVVVIGTFGYNGRENRERGVEISGSTY